MAPTTITQPAAIQQAVTNWAKRSLAAGWASSIEANDTAFGREVAVKVLQEKFGTASGAARRFADEARITGQLQLPGHSSRP